MKANRIRGRAPLKYQESKRIGTFRAKTGLSYETSRKIVKNRLDCAWDKMSPRQQALAILAR